MPDRFVSVAIKGLLATTFCSELSPAKSDERQIRNRLIVRFRICKHADQCRNSGGFNDHLTDANPKIRKTESAERRCKMRTLGRTTPVKKQPGSPRLRRIEENQNSQLNSQVEERDSRISETLHQHRNRSTASINRIDRKRRNLQNCQKSNVISHQRQSERPDQQNLAARFSFHVSGACHQLVGVCPAPADVWRRCFGS